jgi:hypothetical protein
MLGLLGTLTLCPTYIRYTKQQTLAGQTWF